MISMACSLAMRLPSLTTLLFATAFWLISAAVVHGLTCSVDASKNRFSIDPMVTSPAPYTYCFKLKVNKCSTPTSPCCRNSTTATFLLEVDEICKYDNITATLNGQPVNGVTFEEPSADGAGNVARLAVPGLQLNAPSIESSGGAKLCIHLMTGTNCGSVTRLPPAGASKWNAILRGTGNTTTTACCPLTTLRPPAKVKCDTCLVWDVLGPDGTTASVQYDFLSRTSCSLASVDPSDLPAGRVFKNCCEYQAYWAMYGALREAREQRLAVGFSKPLCTRTSMRLCGSFVSQAAGQALAADRAYMGGLREDFDGTDDTCSIALINSTVRLRSLQPASGAPDATCAPIDERIEGVCAEPDRRMWEDGYPPFPNSTCDSTAGATSFTIGKYYEVVYGKDEQPDTTAYCISINTTTPLQPQSACGSSTTLDRVSFWLFDDDSYRRNSYKGSAYMLTKEGAKVQRTNLTASWGPDGERTYNVGSLGLDVATVKAKQPKICIVAENTRLWLDTADGMGFLWTALYDKSGTCCPVFYANRF